MAFKRIDATNSSRNVADAIRRHLNIRYALCNGNKPDDDKEDENKVDKNEYEADKKEVDKKEVGKPAASK